MDETPIFEQIASSLRQMILDGTLPPDGRLPSIRQLAGQWHCTTGTIQHAYHELEKQGLITSRPGKGTHAIMVSGVDTQKPIKHAWLVNRLESVLLEAIRTGYSINSVEMAFHSALDRWRTASFEGNSISSTSLRFVGSHDLAINCLASQFPLLFPGFTLEITYAGSIGGLIAISQGKADIAGVHLWDSETGTYNVPFVKKLLPGKPITLIALAKRNLGFVLAPGNPKNIQSLYHLTQNNVRFVNRQSGSGTRVWLDEQLRIKNIPNQAVLGYENELQTHSEIALAVAENRADVGICLEPYASDYGLDFIQLTVEKYDLVIPDKILEKSPASDLLIWLNSKDPRKLLQQISGYDFSDIGSIVHIE